MNKVVLVAIVLVAVVMTIGCRGKSSSVNSLTEKVKETVCI